MLVNKEANFLTMRLKTIVTKIFFSVTLVVASNTIEAQTEDHIPPFKMLMSDGKFFSSNDVQKNKPVVLIYFAPDCEHCQVLMNEFFKNIDAFKTTQIILVTFKPLQELSAFERLYKTYKYDNIKVGTEGNTFFLRKVLKIDNTPFTALYNKDGKLIYSYRKETPIADLIDRVKQLK
jgi:thiol-disulfide isomerase/thioredoxin